MSIVRCRLCAAHPAIKNSHVTSGFLFRAIKEDSPTGFFRNPNNPNRRLQDGDKVELLCTLCEQRFAGAERKFASRIFRAFHTADQDEFSYGPWLHYFMTSLAWRTLVLELPGLEADSANPRSVIADVATPAETMRQYLLGASALAAALRNHAVVFTRADSASPELVAARPHVLIRRSVFGYSLLDRDHGSSGIIHNLAGFLCFLIVQGNPHDQWHQTKISPTGGEIKQPQRINSWLMADLLALVVDSAQKLATISETQRDNVGRAVLKNPTAAGLRFRESDRGLLDSD